MDAAQLTDVANSTEPRRWRFGLRSLFTATVHVAVVLFLWQWLSFFCFFVLAVFAAPVVFRRNGKARCLVAMKSMTAYFLLSCATLPFLDSLWLGELPVFTVLQVPKVDWAIWLLNVILRKVMWPIGLSISEITARPYVLALTYLLPVGLLCAIVWRRTRMAAPYRFWASTVVVAAIFDFVMMRVYGGGPHVSIY